MSATQFDLTRVLGRALAGVVVASVGAVGCFALNAASSLARSSRVASWVLPPGESAAVEGDPPETIASLMASGNIIRDPSLRGALLTVLLTGFLCGPLIVFCPVLVKTVLLEIWVASAYRSRPLTSAGCLVRSRFWAWMSSRRDEKAASVRGSPNATVPCQVLHGIRSMVLGVALPAGESRASPDDREQHVRKFAATGLMYCRDLLGQTVSLYMLAMRGGVSLGSMLTGLSASLDRCLRCVVDQRIPAPVTAQVAVVRRWIASPAIDLAISPYLSDPDQSPHPEGAMTGVHPRRLLLRRVSIRRGDPSKSVT